jgi:GntR family transcriptional regulator
MFSHSATAADPPVIQLDDASPTPKYQQIAEQVRALVAARRLLPGTALPSVRQLAADLGININTVLAAYRTLEADGVVLLRRGSRAVIHPRLAKATLPAPADLTRIHALLERVRTDALLAGMTPQQLQALAEQVFAADPASAQTTPAEER